MLFYCNLEEYNQILTKDAHMLKKILEYNQKMYGFSFRS